MSSLKMEHLENPKIHFLFDLSCQEANVNPIVIVEHVMRILTVIITAASYFLILLRLNVFIALLAVAVTIPLLLIGNKRELYEFQSRYDEQIMDLNRRISYFSSIVKEPLYAKDNAVYNVGTYFLKKRKQYKEALVNRKAGYICKAMGISICVAFMTLATQYGVYFFLGVNVLNDTISIGSLSLYFNAFATILLALNQIVDSLSYINAQVELGFALTEFMQLPEIGMKEGGIHYRENINIRLPLRMSPLRIPEQTGRL